MAPIERLRRLLRRNAMERVKRLLRSSEPVTWVFYGDSITHGALHTEGWRDYVEIFAERVRYELALTRQTIINSALSGDTTRGLLAGFQWRVAQFHPQVVPVMIGMNDCSSGNDITAEEFAANLHALADRVEALGAVTLLQTTCPILPGQAPDRSPHIDAYMDVVRRVARERGLPLIDHTEYWKAHTDTLFY
jgi:acyl-CoA thioesterase I